MAARTGVLDARRLEDVQTGGYVFEFFRDGLANARLRLSARADLVGVGHVDFDAVARQRPGQRTPARRPSDAITHAARSLPRILFDRVGRSAGLIRQLRKGEPQLIRAD